MVLEGLVEHRPVDAAASVGVLAATAAGVVVSVSWRAPDRDDPIEMFEVLRMRNGRIFDIQDHQRRQSALRAVGARD